MDYEQKYKEVLVKAQRELQCCGDLNCDAARQIFRLFPELSESEDERISREITEFLVDYYNGEYKRPNENTIDSWLSWLEKQGEQKTIKEYNVPNIPIKDSEVVTSRIKYIDENLKPIAEFVMDYANWDLRKDEWNQPVATVPLFRVLDALVQNGKQYSEEHFVVDNNTKPKFKVGDWITNGEVTWKIDKVFDTNYIDTAGAIHDIEFTDANYHLWSIEDAKDGDVLAIGDEYFLFKEKKENTSPAVYISHCFSNSAGAFRVTNGRDCGEFLSIENGINVCPATKEQRGLLFQKMKEAGYKWDSENKQLAKIV